jgi:hypothetical protein
VLPAGVTYIFRVARECAGALHGMSFAVRVCCGFTESILAF